MKKYVVIFWGIIIGLSGWKIYTVNNKISNVYESSASDEEKEEEETSMKREFCEVIEEGSKFVLKNTKGEIYYLDSSFKEDLKNGDDVLLIYTKRWEIKENVYEADIYAIYPDSTELQMPAK